MSWASPTFSQLVSVRKDYAPEYTVETETLSILSSQSVFYIP